MKTLFVSLMMSTLLLSAISRADTCPDVSSQEKVGLALVLQVAKAALPGVDDVEFTVSDEKESHLGKWDKYWYDGQLDSLSFGIVVGKKSAPGSHPPYKPAVAYEVKVDTNCKATTELMYSIEN